MGSSFEESTLNVHNKKHVEEESNVTNNSEIDIRDRTRSREEWMGVRGGMDR